MKAIDKVREQYITEDELAQFLGLTKESLRDLRSHHRTGKQEFIPFRKLSNKCIVYEIDDVMNYIFSSPVFDFKS